MAGQPKLISTAKRNHKNGRSGSMARFGSTLKVLLARVSARF
jgi:hypothetical protein